MQEIVANNDVEIRVDTRIKTDVKIKHDRSDLLVYDKKNNVITLVEVGIINFDLLTQIENEKLRKYDLIANEFAMMYKSKYYLM